MFDLVFLGTAAAVPSADRGSPALLVICGRRGFSSIAVRGPSAS